MSSLTQRILDYISKSDDFSESAFNHFKPSFNPLALELFAYQYQHCAPYQFYCQQLNQTPENTANWQQIPAVSTEVFREFPLSTFPIADARYIFQTSGTTSSSEKKGKHYYHDMTLYDAAIQASFMSGIGLKNINQPTIGTSNFMIGSDKSMTKKPIFRVLTPSFKEVSTSSLFYMFEHVLAWYGHEDSCFYFHENNLNNEELAQDLMVDCAQNIPVILLGTAFSFVNFCDYLDERKMSFILPKGSRLLETGGLKGKTRSVSRDELYDLFKTKLGLDLNHCFSEYGMTELSSQCYSKPDSHVFSSPHWMPTQIIHPETGKEVAIGQTGLVQFFDLANYSAVSAVITSDLAVRHPQGFELVGRAPKAVLRGCSTAFER